MCAALAAPARADIAIWVVRHGWHTGIVLPRAHLTPATWPEAAHFAASRYVEVGWGDRDFYMGRDFGLWKALKALLWPTPGVLHVVSLDRIAPAQAVELHVTPQGLDRLVRYVSASFARPGGEAPPLGAALYGEGAFYPSRETFHLFRTCNVWSARALRAAGVPIDSVLFAGSLMAQARSLTEAHLPPSLVYAFPRPD